MLYNKELYNWYKANGICVHCEQRDSEKGRVLCLVCWDKQAERNKKQVLDENRKLVMRSYSQKRRIKLRAEGVCVSCGKRSAADGHPTCHICQRRDRERKKARAHERGVLPYELRGKGYCWYCCKPNDNGRKTCDACREKSAANLEKLRARIDYSNHIFRKMNDITFGG